MRVDWTTGEDFVGFCQSRSLYKIPLCFLRPLIPPAWIARSSPRRFVGKFYVPKLRNPVACKLPQGIDGNLIHIDWRYAWCSGFGPNHLHDLRHKGRTYLKNYKGNQYLSLHPVWLFLEVLHAWCPRASVVPPILIICSWQGIDSWPLSR